MKRIIRVPKTRGNSCKKNQKGKTWVYLAIWSAIMPDEMEAIVNAASKLTKATLDWTFYEGSYAVIGLFPENEGAVMQSYVCEVLEWLKPIHDKNRDWAIASGLEFEAAE